MTERALRVAADLEKERVNVAVLHVPTIKPLDVDTVLAEVSKDRKVFVLENHSVVGGLFESVASALVQRGVSRQVTPIGLPDEFLDAGALPTLHDRYGVSVERIRERVRDAL